jgi:aminocarboxymuconate-semialdehyde decarboxylase
MAIERRRFLGGMAAIGGALLAGCAGAPAQRGMRGYNVKVVDLHAHWVPPDWLALVEKEGGDNGAKIGKNARGETTLDVPGISYVFQEHYTGFGTRLKAMDAEGIDIQALSLTTPMVYWAPPAFGLKLSQVYNDALAAAHLAYPERFYGLATLPMQDPNLAVQELDRAANLPGIRGVYMATHINGKNLDDKSLWPVYARCEALALPLFLHPQFNAAGVDRMRSYYLRNFLGNPYDTGIAAALLMFSGVLDTYPKLEVVLPHAGGTFPWLTGRMDHGVTTRSEVKHMKRPPSAYLRRFYYDTITHSGEILLDLVRMVGADRVVIGSDQPSDMSYEQPLKFVEDIPQLSAGERELIIGGNAARLLKI